MVGHRRFHYKNIQALKAEAESLHISIPLAEDTKILKTPISFSSHVLSNRMGVAPMEGADSLPDGSPSELTKRRYVRDAEGGSAIIWFEAISIVPEGRSSATQMYIDRNNVEAFKRLTDEVKEAGIKKNGYAPYLIMQANHSGRYSNPDNSPHPLIAFRNPFLEKFRPSDDENVVTDDYLKGLEEKFGEAAGLARKAGFDAVDIKSCHGYLLQELAAAYLRKGLYGGSFENRTRLLRNGIKAAKVYETKDFMVTARIGLYDGYPYPYGFGVGRNAGYVPDLSEPIRLVKILHEDLGLSMVNLTMGNPYVTTHITRPFDVGKYQPEEHPLEGIARMINGIGEVKSQVPEMIIYASAPTYLREFSDLYAAGAVEQNFCDGMLFGRMSFANPDFANEIIQQGRINPEHICLTCGKCGDLIRAHQPTGCMIRDTAAFLPYYKKFQEIKKNQPENFRG